MQPPIHDARLCLPLSGIACRVWMEDGSEETATMHCGKWECWKGDLQPVRWQRLVPLWGTSTWHFDLGCSCFRFSRWK